jgi:hypothetical protein
VTLWAHHFVRARSTQAVLRPFKSQGGVRVPTGSPLRARAFRGVAQRQRASFGSWLSSVRIRPPRPFSPRSSIGQDAGPSSRRTEFDSPSRRHFRPRLSRRAHKRPVEAIDFRYRPPGSTPAPARRLGLGRIPSPFAACSPHQGTLARSFVAVVEHWWLTWLIPRKSPVRIGAPQPFFGDEAHSVERCGC